MNKGKLDVLAEQALAHAEPSTPPLKEPKTETTSPDSPNSTRISALLGVLAASSVAIDNDNSNATTSSGGSSSSNSNSSSGGVKEDEMDDSDNDDVRSILGDNPARSSSASILSCGKDLLSLFCSVQTLDPQSHTFSGAADTLQDLLTAVHRRLCELEEKNFLNPRELLAVERLRVLETKISETLRIARMASLLPPQRQHQSVGVVVTAYPDSSVLKQTTKYKNKPLRFVIKIIHLPAKEYELVSAEARHELAGSSSSSNNNNNNSSSNNCGVSPSPKPPPLPLPQDSVSAEPSLPLPSLPSLFTLSGSSAAEYEKETAPRRKKLKTESVDESQIIKEIRNTIQRNNQPTSQPNKQTTHFFSHHLAINFLFS